MDVRTRMSRGQRFEPVSGQEIIAYEHFLSKMDIEMSAFDWDMLMQIDVEWQRAQPDPSMTTSPPRRSPPAPRFR